MTIALQTDRKATQLVQNVEDLFSAIEHYYHVPHKQRNSSSGLRISFGRNPVKENCIEFSPYSLKSKLRIDELNSDFVLRVVGDTPMQLGKEIDAIRKADGNDAAEDFQRTLKDKFDAFLGVNCASLSLNTYHSGKISLTMDISNLTNDVLDAVSEVLKHSGLTPKAQSTRQHEL